MNNLQKIKQVAKECGLLFVRTNSKLNGAYLYNFTDTCGQVVARNWTIASAIQEYNYGNLKSKLE